jgi:hypothetical protein
VLRVNDASSPHTATESPEQVYAFWQRLRVEGPNFGSLHRPGGHPPHAQTARPEVKLLKHLDRVTLTLQHFLPELKMRRTGNGRRRAGERPSSGLWPSRVGYLVRRPPRRPERLGCGGVLLRRQSHGARRPGQATKQRWISRKTQHGEKTLMHLLRDLTANDTSPSKRPTVKFCDLFVEDQRVDSPGVPSPFAGPHSR